MSCVKCLNYSEAYFVDAECSNRINPAWLFYTGEHVRPEGSIACAVVACELCGEDSYGESCDRGDAPVCQDAPCINCGEICWGWGCNYNTGDEESRHDGIHAFHLAAGARLKYVEKHYGDGDGNGKRVMNPTTVINIAEGGYMEMETTQIRGIDSTDRKTVADLKDNANLIVKEKLLTHQKQVVLTDFVVDLNGENSGADVISRSVATDES